MRSTLIFIGVAAVIIGAGLYAYLPEQFLNSPPDTSPTTTNSASASNTQAQASAVTFRVLDTGARAAGISARKNYAAYSEENFMKMWKMAHGTDGTALPKIDFSREYVIGVFAGQKSTGGNSIAVTAVTDTLDARTVAVRLTSPGAGCIVTQSLTNPYQIIAVPLSAAPLAHTDTEVAAPCN